MHIGQWTVCAMQLQWIVMTDESNLVQEQLENSENKTKESGEKST